MIINDQDELKTRIKQMTGRDTYGRVEIVEDTSDYMRILGGMVLRLEGNDYFITGDATEGRFGIDDQPKFWVKYAYDLEDGARKVIKLVFHEDFTSREGFLLIKGTRSPDKEAHCLEVVRGHKRFMQGFSVRDPKGNLVRIVDFVRGKTLFYHLFNLDLEHEEYFHQVFPQVMSEVLDCFEALKFLHERGEHHGDVRNDHIIIEAETGDYKWIDFDYHISYEDYDIWSCGNILNFVVGKKIVTFQEVKKHPERFPSVQESTLTADDALLFYKYRIANLQKLYPYIPDKLNRVLMNFSNGTYFFYEEFTDLLNDLKEALTDLPRA